MHADVVVIGAGMAGASVAAELAGCRRVLLLDQEPHPGFHATGRSAALFSALYGNATVQALTRASRQYFLSADHSTRLTAPRSSLYIATGQQLESLEAFACDPMVRGVVTRLSTKEALDLVPKLRVAYLGGAVLEPDSYDLDVSAIHQGYLRQLKARGGKVVCSQRLNKARYQSGVWRIDTSTDTLESPILVNAAGAWGDLVAQCCGVCPVGLAPLRRTALLARRPDGLDCGGWPMVIDIAAQFYFKPDAGNLLISPADETPSVPGDVYADEFDVATAIDRFQQAVDIDVNKVVSSWAGLRTFTPDRTPIVGFDDQQPGFFWLVGQGGFGIQTAPALARIACAGILGERMPQDLQSAGVDTGALAIRRAAAHGH